MSKLSVNCYDKIICPYNCSGQWELVVIFPHQKTVMYLDPLGENDKKKKSILQPWKTFINRRFSAGLESSGPSKWKIETAQHCKQLDSVGCGVYVMKFAELLLQRKPLFFNFRQMDTIRLEIASILLGNCAMFLTYVAPVVKVTNFFIDGYNAILANGGTTLNVLIYQPHLTTQSIIPFISFAKRAVE